MNGRTEKITVQNAAKNKIGVTYTEDGVEYDYLNGEQTVIMNEKKTYATITKTIGRRALILQTSAKVFRRQTHRRLHTR